MNNSEECVSEPSSLSTNFIGLTIIAQILVIAALPRRLTNFFPSSQRATITTLDSSMYLTILLKNIVFLLFKYLVTSDQKIISQRTVSIFVN